MIEGTNCELTGATVGPISAAAVGRKHKTGPGRAPASGYVGVYRQRRAGCQDRWRAVIWEHGKPRTVRGRLFATKEQAALARAEEVGDKDLVKALLPIVYPPKAPAIRLQTKADVVRARQRHGSQYGPAF
jgi:hypothetical protein